MDLITPFFLKLLDKNIIKQINSINTDFLCLGPLSSCGGHYPANREEVLITYIWKDFNENNSNSRKEKLKAVRENLEFNFPFLTLVFLDKNEFERLLENLTRFNFNNYEKVIKNVKTEDDKEKIKQEILDKLKEEKENPEILICYFKFEDCELNGEKNGETKIIEYYITFTCLYRFSWEEINLSPGKKNFIIQKIGSVFIKSIHDFLKSDLFDFKSLLGEIKEEQIRNCKCHRLNELCIDAKHEYLNSRVNLMKKELKIRNEVVLNMLSKSLRTRGVLLRNKNFIYKGTVIQDIIREVDKILYEFNY